MSGLDRWEHWPEMQVWASYTESVPPDEFVQSVHVVVFASVYSIYICEDETGQMFLPGGTREPAETIERCADRELMEEAGVEATSPYIWIGAHNAIGYKTAPYRAHLPHPRKAWLWGVCNGIQIAKPSNPPGAETVVAVHLMTIEEAADALRPTGKWYDDLLQRAALAATFPR